MLENTFFTYNLVSFSEEAFEANITFAKDHSIYKGHFPQQPVTPGVCQIQAVKEVFAKLLGQKLVLSSAKEVKFLNLHVPEIDNIQLKARYSKQDDGFALTASLEKDTVIYTKLKAHFGTV
ncbi:MAG: hypothetical protein IPO21_13865 [Bacteroidales bacterium]|nr:hypothetical protein [Bacteroidales bacterium]